MKSRRKPAAFRLLCPAETAGEYSTSCWTSGGRFAKRPALAKAFPGKFGRIAQLVEQLTLNQRVPGSSPGAPTKQIPEITIRIFFGDLRVDGRFRLCHTGVTDATS